MKFLKFALIFASFVLTSCGSGDMIYGIPASKQWVGVVTDSSVNPQNIYVTDFGLSVVQQIDLKTLATTTIAGQSGAFGYFDGLGTNAVFNGPEGIVFSNNQLFIADAFNNVIRNVAITSPYAVQAYAGNSKLQGSSDGTLMSSTFSVPRGIVADNQGNFYITDSRNQTIRQISNAGVVTTIAGFPGAVGNLDGLGSAARFSRPWGITIDNAKPQNLYVTDSNNNLIRKLTPTTQNGMTTWSVSTIAGNSNLLMPGNMDGTGQVAQFNYPLGIASDGSNLYVADNGNNTIRKISLQTGIVSTIAGGGPNNFGFVDGIGRSALFYQLAGLTFSAGKLFIVDQDGLNIRIMDLSSLSVNTLKNN
jgi:NHL repeat